MILLLDIGNTHTHLGLATVSGIRRTRDVPTARIRSSEGVATLQAFIGKARLGNAVLASVVPDATPAAQAAVIQLIGRPALQLTPATLRGVALDYPRPQSIGQDRLANAIAAHHHFGAPSVVVDFGTAVTFDVVSPAGAYVGGIIAPGLSAMTDYLHEKTALLPRITIRTPRSVIGRSTREAMLSGAVHGYRGLVSELIRQLKTELGVRRLPVVATGGYAQLIAREVPAITAVQPHLTLEGLRLLALLHGLEPG